MIQQSSQQPYPDPLGSLVKHVREQELQLSQSDLAWLAGVSRGTISNLETGRVNPDTRTWQRIASALAVPPTSLDRVRDGDDAWFLFPADAVRGVIEAILTIREQDPDTGLRIAERWRRLVLRASREDNHAWSTTNPELSWVAQELAVEAPGMAPLLHAAVQGRSVPDSTGPWVQPMPSPAVPLGLDQVQDLANTVSNLAEQLRVRDDRVQGFERLPTPVQDLVARGLVVSCDVTSPETAPGVALVNLVVMSEGESSLAAQQEAHDAARRWSTILSVVTHIVEREAPDLAPEDIIQALKTGLDAQSPAEVSELLPQARSGDPLAMYKLARLLRKYRRPDEAELWFHRAAGVGHPGALFVLGTLAYEGGRRSEAERWWRDAAEAGHPDAMYSLWALLREEDPQGAEKWLRAAAAAENRKAMYRLWQLNRGYSNSEAEQWLRKAADHGHIEAITDLSKLVAERGAEDEAVRWMRRAAEDGDTGTMTVYEVMLYERRMRERAAARHAS
jgi:TPR repeat protein/DNA-binding XRE family transcriptional regulator